MAQIISYGGYGDLEFSDKASDAQIKDYVDRNYKAIENRFNVPHSDPAGLVSPILPDALERGVLNAKKAFNVVQFNLGLNTLDDALYDIRRYDERAKQIPMDKRDKETLTKVVKSKSLGGALSALGENPMVIFPVLGESIGQYLPTIALGAAPPLLLARGLAGSLLAAGGTGLGSGLTEYGGSVIDALAEAGVNTDDGMEMAQALADPVKMKKAKQYALDRGVPIGVFDAASFGMAGILTKAIRDSGRKILGSQLATTLGASGAEIAQAGSLGAMGEYVAQISADGRVTSPGSILLETIAEGPLGIVEAGINLRNEYKAEPDINPEVDDGQPITQPKILSLPSPTKTSSPTETVTVSKQRLILNNLQDQLKKAKTKKEKGNITKQITDAKKLFTQQREATLDLIRGKLSSYLITASKQSTADGIGNDLVDPKKIREKALTPYERQFLIDMDERSKKKFEKDLDKDPFGKTKKQLTATEFEAEIYKDLFDKRILNVESTVNDRGETVANYFTFSPFDIESLKKAEAEQEIENKKKPIIRKLKPSKLKWPFNFEKLKLKLGTRTATVAGITASSPTEFNLKYKEKYGRNPDIQSELMVFNRKLNSTPQYILDEQAESSQIELSPTLDVTNKGLIQDLAKSFNLFKRKAKRGKSSAFLGEGEFRALDTITKLTNEDERSPGLIQFLRGSLAQKIGQRVPTKIIQDQNGDVQGQVQKLALSGRSFLDVGTGQPRGIPGPGSVFVAVDIGNPDNNRIFMTEKEAATHLDKSLKKRKVNINKVKTNLVPNLPQENFLKNIRDELNRIAQDRPDILNQANDDFVEMNNDEQLRIIESEFLDDAKLIKIQDLIARGRKGDTVSGFSRNLDPDAVTLNLTDDARDTNLLRAAGVSMHTEVNKADYEIEQIDQEPTPTYTAKEKREQDGFIRKAIDTMKSFIGDKFLNLLVPWVNSAYHLAQKSKPIARIVKVLEQRSSLRQKILEQLQRIVGEKFNNLDDAQVAEVFKVAMFARAAQLQINTDSEFRVSDNEIYIPPSVLQSDRLGVGGKPLKDIVIPMLNGTVPPEGLRLTGDEVVAYDALLQMGQFERDLMVQDTLEDLMTNLQDVGLVINSDTTNLKSGAAIQSLVDTLKGKYFETDENGKIKRNKDKTPILSVDSISEFDGIILDRTLKRLEAIAKNYDSTYVPLSRNGDKFVSVTENTIGTNPDGEPKDVKRTIYWMAFETQTGKNIFEMNKAKTLDRELKERFSPKETIVNADGKRIPRYVFSGVRNNTYDSMKEFLPNDFASSLDTFLQLMPTDSIPGREELLQKANQLEGAKLLPSFLSQSYMIPGFDFENSREALGRHINSFATWNAGFKFDSRLKKVLTEGDFNEMEAKYRDELVNYLNRDPYEWQQFRQIAFMYYLTDISASVMNLFQSIPAGVHIGAYSGMRKAAKGQVKTMANLRKALKPNLKTDNQFDYEKLKKMYGSTIPLFNDPDQLIGTVVAPSRANEYLANETSGLMRNTRNVLGTKGFSNKIEKSTRLTGLLFTTTEAANRLSTYINSFEQTADFDTLRRGIEWNLESKLFQDKLRTDYNLDPDTILNNFEQFRNDKDMRNRLGHLIAETAVAETQFMYGRHVKPRISRGAGAVFFQFTEYPTMMLEFLKRLYDRPGGKKAFATYVGALLLTSGFMGLPFVTDLSEIYELITKKNAKKELYEVLGEATNPKIAEALMLGLSRSLTGTSIGPRVGLGTHPITGAAIDLFGGHGGATRLNIPIAGVVRQLKDAMSYAQEDDYALAIASALPKVLGAPIKAIYQGRDGIRTRSGEKVMLPENVDTWDQVVGALGFTSADIAREREAIWMAKSLKNASAPIQRRFMRRIQKHQGALARAIKDNDEEKIKNARARLSDVYFDIQEYNREAIDEGESYRVIRPNKSTVQGNLRNELMGIPETVSTLPKITRPEAQRVLRIVPRGIDNP